MALRHVSPSSWGLFEQCVLAWAARYILGERDDGSVYTVAGQAFHQVPEYVYLHEPEVRYKVAPLAKEQAIEEHAPEYRRHGGTTDELAKKVHEWWLMLTSIEHPSRIDVVTTEERHQTVLNGVPVNLVTDRLVRVPSKRRKDVIVGRLDDYKTGKKRPARRQMVMGAAAIEQRHGIKVPTANLVYVATGEVHEVLTGETAQRSVLDDLAKTWDAMREAELTGNWPANPSPLCNWCSHLPNCKPGKKAADEWRRNARRR